MPNLVTVNNHNPLTVKTNGNNPAPILPDTNVDGNAPKPQHVLSIYDVHENLFRHYSEGDLENSLEDLLEDMTKQAVKNGKLAANHATGPPHNAGPNGKQGSPQKTSSTEWESATDDRVLTEGRNNPFKRPKTYEGTDSSTESVKAIKQSRFMPGVNGIGRITASTTNTIEDEGSNTNKGSNSPLVIPQTTSILSPGRNTDEEPGDSQSPPNTSKTIDDPNTSFATTTSAEKKEVTVPDSSIESNDKDTVVANSNGNSDMNIACDVQTVIIFVLNNKDAAKFGVDTFLRKISERVQIPTKGVNEKSVIVTPVEQDEAIIFNLWYPATPRFHSDSNASFKADVHGMSVSLFPTTTDKDPQAGTNRPILILYPVPPFGATNSEDLNMLSTDVRDFQLHLEEENSRRAKRILKNIYYVFVDLHYHFGNAEWEENVRVMQDGYAYTAKQTGKRALIAISRVHLLHRRIGEIYRLRGLRTIHSEALDCFLDLAPRVSGAAGESHGIWEEEEKQNRPKITSHEKNEGRGLKARLLSIGKELNYHEQNLVNLHERFRNLIDLEFNIQSTVTNQNIEAITYLAFLFAPLSFVAACFGVNGIQAPHWFWVTCLPVLAAGVTCAFFMRPTVSLFARLQSDIHGLVLDHQEQGRFERWVSEKVKRRRNRGGTAV